MINVNYISNCFDSSGYANAAKNNVAALDKVGVKVDLTAITFESFRSDAGIVGRNIAKLMVDKSDARIQIIHATPPVFKRFHDPSKYNIAYTTWETSELPPGWKDAINTMNEVWVPCQENKDIFLASGVTRPIYVIPHTFNIDIFNEEATSLSLQNIGDDEYKFYSIFQWTERKNPVGLLKAYMTEFDPDEKVCLVLKTYMMDPTNGLDANKVKAVIGEIKEKLYLKKYPKIVLISELLSRSQINSIHKQMDCYLSFHRNEGFGIPIVESMMAGKPVIATNYGGPLDFLRHKQNSLLCKYQLTPCFNMPWDTYNGKMNWADIDILDARAHMRYAYQNQQAMKELGNRGLEDIRTNYSWEKVGNMMKERLLAV